MSEPAINPAEVQKDHAIVHFFALVAGIEDVRLQIRLLASGIGTFLKAEAVVLAFEDAGDNTCNVEIWHGGNSSEFRTNYNHAGGIEAVVSAGVETLGYRASRTLALIHLGRVMGYLAVARREPAQLTAEEDFLLSSFQSLAALLLSNHAEQRHAKAAIHRRNRILAGINRIFQEALNCETEEQLGRSCLRVAEEITGSQFGFVAEIGADGLLHTIAISNPGWDACSMRDDSGARRLPTSFAIHGLYGRVMLDSKSVLTNDPAGHPDSIGTPSGHPPLTAFLGVPLTDGGRTTGMVALGNCPAGYTQAERESLEALAPAIVQVLHHKRTEQALIRSEKLVSVGRLAATIAHEINNPLEAATNAVYLVREDTALSARSRLMAETAEQELRRAAEIARRTLGFYREPNARRAVPIAELLADITALYETRIRNSNVEMRVRHRDKGSMALGNPGELRQVFSNLLANSIDAVGAGGIVHIRTGAAAGHAGAFLNILIADTGSGIEAQNLPRLFEPFFTTKKDVGIGLGLWISEQVVRQHGGSIRVRSRVGRGTVFCVRLPAAAEAHRPFAAAASCNM